MFIIFKGFQGLECFRGSGGFKKGGSRSVEIPEGFEQLKKGGSLHGDRGIMLKVSKKL